MVLGSTVLEIAIGLIFLYLLLALVSSAVNEWIAGVLKLRAKTLREGIANLLEDPEMAGLAKRFYDHPLVKGLGRKGDAPLPSYISSDTFAVVLIDLLLPGQGENKPRDLLEVYESIRTQLGEFAGGESDLAKTVLLLLNRAGVDPVKVQEAGDTVREMELLRKQLTLLAQQIDESNVETLKPLAESLQVFQELEHSYRQAEDQVRATLIEAQTNVERFYDQSMERVSGWYKRRAQAIIVVIAFLVTVLFNADSLAIANRLAVDPILRAEIADAAQEYVIASQEPADESVPTDEGNGENTSDADSSTARLDELQELGLPLGWESETLPQITGDPSQWLDAWLHKIAGLLLTVVAVSLGAPFWFELLNKLVNLRMAGKVPAAVDQPMRVTEGTILAAKMGGQPAPRAAFTPQLPPPAAAPKAVDLDELALRALAYVEELKARNLLTGDEREAAEAWMLVKVMEQGLPATREEIGAALDRQA